MKNKRITKIVLLLLLVLGVSSCERNFLEEKPDKSLLIPTTLEDFRALLDNASIMNQTPYLPLIAGDNIYTTDAGYASTSSLIRNVYIWKKDDLYEGTTTIHDWNRPYQSIYYANTVLDGLSKIKIPEKANEDIKGLKGQALFYRAFFHYLLAEEFSKAYQIGSAETELGIPLRLSSDVQQQPIRSTLAQTYGQILNDLTAAENLLPLNVPYKTRPGRKAGLALLARVYLTVRNYHKALEYADRCLQISGQLLDYNELMVNDPRPFPISYKDLNNEVLFYSTVLSVSFLSRSPLTLIDKDLFNSYHSGDLRKQAFFSVDSIGVRFKGNYSGTSGVFSGLALDEMYLIKAECNARLGNTVAAMDDLNTLLKNRWSNKVSFPELIAKDEDDALKQVLLERRKELVYRGMRWSDLKRLNQEDQYAQTLNRTIGNVDYVLPPNDDRYVFPIPDAEIVSSGIAQNER